MRHALLLSLGLTLTAAPALAAPKVWSQEWNVTSRPDVHVVVHDAHVRVHAGPAGRVTARVEYELKRWGLLVGVSQPTVVFERKGDQIRISAREPHNIGVVGGMDERMTLDLTLPAEVTLSVRSRDGALDCEPLTGRFTFESGDGAVRGHGLKGVFEVSTGNGRVILDDLDGRLSARTGDGHLGVTGRFDALDLTTGNGRVSVTALPGSKLAQGWSLETGDGSVTLKVPHDIATLLDARTRGGHIDVQLPIAAQGRLKESSLVGELNGGGPPLRIRTGDGAITLALSD